MTSLSENTVVTTSGGLVELFYTSKSTTVAINNAATSQASVIGPVTIVSDGSPIIVDFYCEEAAAPATAGGFIIAALWVDGAEVTRTMGVVYAGATGSNHGTTLLATQRLVLSAGTHTIEIKGWSSAAGNFYAGAGGTAAYAPMWLRVSKVVQASQFIVPLASAPLVTSLPSAPIDGQEIRYVADATNGIIWNLRYRAASSSAYKWEFVGGSGLYAQTLNSTGAISATGSSFVSAGSNNLSLNIDLPGEYTTIISGVWGGDSAGAWLNVGLSGAGFSPSDTDSLRFTAVSGSYYFSGSQSRTRTFTTTGTVSMVYRVSAGGAVFAERNMTFIPIRVKAP